MCSEHIQSDSVLIVVFKYLNRMMSKTLASLFNKCFSESGLTEYRASLSWSHLLSYNLHFIRTCSTVSGRAHLTKHLD